MSASIDDIAKQMLVLLPEDGTPVLNRVMRVMLARALSADIDEDRYIAARQALVDRGEVGVQPGPGGRLSRKPRGTTRQARRQEASDGWTEARLMPCLRKYLNGPIQNELGILRGAKCLTYDTSSVGRTGVQWARPDFTLISVKQFKFLPGIEFDVHSFELKAESGGASDLAVYEALAQTRFTNFGYLVWHLPGGSRFEKKLSGIEKQCSQHGIGFIRAHEPQQFETWDILVEPARKTTPSAEIDLFLEERLQDQQRRQIRSLLNGAPA
ncbi:MAG: hypothetical protein AB7V13_02970 [Pseudorhodoplanes sp.]|uniref:hypothetical protein n=1 Tax=Pseudorhodoplanes sp. TaxID=1934341 RepID=UPI003D097AB8